MGYFGLDGPASCPSFLFSALVSLVFLCLYARTMPRPTRTPSASRPKPFAYRPPDPKRATLLFDLDHTLVEVQSQARSKCVTMPTAATGYKFSRFTTPAPTFDRFPAHGMYSTIPDLQDATRAQSIVHYRPHIVPFLRFCFKHFNVGFWSTAAAINVHHIALNLLRLVDRQPADLMCAWARRNIRGSSNLVPEAVKFIDALTNEELPPPARGVRVASKHKDLHYVYARFPKLRRNYITLVDNLPSHAVGNPSKGVLWIPPFSFLNAHDTVLDVLLRRLQRLWRERCTDKKTRKGVTTGDAKRTPGHTTAKGVATTPTKAKPPTKPAPPPPLLVNADDLRACLHGVSGTNDGELYPGGYVTNGANRAYTMTSRQLRCYQPVLLSVNGHYQRGSVRKVDRAKGTATVRVTRPTTPPPDVAYIAEQPKVPTQGTRKRTISTGTRRRTNTMKPAYEEMVVPVSALLDYTTTEELMEKAYGVSA